MHKSLNRDWGEGGEAMPGRGGRQEFGGRMKGKRRREREMKIKERERKEAGDGKETF